MKETPKTPISTISSKNQEVAPLDMTAVNDQEQHQRLLHLAFPSPTITPPPTLSGMNGFFPPVLNRVQGLPAFAFPHPVGYEDFLLDEIMDLHRCYRCNKRLCCGANFGHDINCWAVSLYGNTSFTEIMHIYEYRIQILRGALMDMSDWAFQPFDQSIHFINGNFRPHYVGFFIRCFVCPCSNKCTAPYHNH
mmetsp:Transcript_31942/g.40960  ORF Transcript_31942/g.40960 Transcript_31942/m.40960 type:complete len:192 (+) Transcript_31942:2207-2782(+)